MAAKRVRRDGAPEVIAAVEGGRLTVHQARAIRRCGELLRAIEPQQGGDRGNAATGGHPAIGESRKSVAEAAGLSEQQRKTALRVANVPAEEFEAAVGLRTRFYGQGLSVEAASRGGFSGEGSRGGSA